MEVSRLFASFSQTCGALRYRCLDSLLTKSSKSAGVGKCSQCLRLAADLRLVQVSVGASLREEAMKSTLPGDFWECISNGEKGPRQISMRSKTEIKSCP